MKTKLNDFEDIIDTRICQENGHFWYEHLWSYHRGKRTTYSICDDDGDHVSATKKDAEAFEASVTESLLNYSRHVIATGGTDPLGEFTCKRSKKIVRNVMLYLSPWIGQSTHGLAATGIRWAKGLQSPDEVPKGLRDYCLLEKKGGRWLAPWKNEAEIREDLKDAQEVGYIGSNGAGSVWIKLKAEWQEPRDEKIVRREIVRAAKKHLAREAKLAKA